VQAIDLQPGVDAPTAFRAATSSLAREGRLRPRWGQGGLCLFSAETWNDIGGFESRFHGWGNEDNDFADRVRRSGRRLRWIGPDDLRIFHVWHPPSHVSKDIIAARSANQQLYAGDRSTFRSVRFVHSKRASIPGARVTTPRPLVTVAIASRARPGRERMLLEAIRGFAGQIGNDFEVVVADNGSTPEESERLGKALARLPRSLRVRTIGLARPSIPASRNRITDEALGRYICVADDDDIPLPNRLADHLATFEREPELHGSHGGWIDFDELVGIVDFNTGGERKLETMLFGSGKVTAHPSSFFRRDAMRAVRYDESLTVGSDLDLAVRMANMGLRIGHTGSYVTLRRFHQTNVTITDLHGQVTVGVDSRQRVADTLGDAYEQKLRELGRAAPRNVACGNPMGRLEVVSRLPAYVGVWRLLVPLLELAHRGGSGIDDVDPSAPELLAPPAPNGSEDGDLPSIARGDEARAFRATHRALAPSRVSVKSKDRFVQPAEELARMLDGDIGVVDCGFNPLLFFVSEPIKGIGRALKLQKQVEERLDLGIDLITDVEYERRRTKRFDWTSLTKESRADRLVSKPMKLDPALAALAKLPGNTALRAMTAIVADFNCTEQLFHLVTGPIATPEDSGRVRRLLEKQTGESFRTLGASRSVGGGAAR
jgi:GT2 family glycosyltransferase